MQQMRAVASNQKILNGYDPLVFFNNTQTAY